MPFSFLIPAGVSLLGGLMGSQGKTTGQTSPTSSNTNSSVTHGSSTQNKIDSRIDQAIYGAGGIMPNASAWYMKNHTGLNDKMLAGMNNQWNQLGTSQQGFNQMQNLGMGLMGAGSAGNPYTNNGGGGIAPPQTNYQPAEFNAAASGISPFTMPEAVVAPAMLPSYYDGGYSKPPQAAPAAAAAPAAPAVDPRGVWLEDTEGGGYWSNVGRAGGYTGYRGDAYNPAPAYQFNNGYTAYGADGSSASDPSGGGDYGFGGYGGYGGWGDSSDSSSGGGF